jgi:multiple sugar transport system substrate-binding protein
MESKKKVAGLSRRQFIVLGAQSVAALALARCATPTTEAPPAATQAPAATQPLAATAAPTTPPEPTAEPTKAPVTLEFLAWGDNADIPAWDKLVAEYKNVASHATITVTAVAEPNANFYPKLQTAIAGGTPPAVASFQGWEWQTYADQDVLAAIDDHVAADDYFKDVYPEGIASIEGTTVRNGARYLIPLQRAAMLMFYSKKAFDDAGLAYPTDDWTFDEFVEMAKKLTGASGDQKKFGIQANGGWFRDIGWIRGTGKQEFDELYDPRKSQFNQPEIVNIVQKVASDWYYTDKIAPTPADLSGGANTINTGNSAMKYEGPWFFGALNSPDLRSQGKNVPFDVVLMPKMADDSRPHRGWTEGVALLATDLVDEAWAFASFMGGETGDKIYAETTGRVPNTTALIESFWLPVVEEKFEVKNAKAFIEAFDHGEVDVVGKVPRSKMWSEVVKPVAWDPLIGGTAKAADVLPKVDEGVQKLLDEAYG